MPSGVSETPTPSTRRRLRYTAKVAKFQEQFDALPPEKMEPYELPEGTTDDDADAYVDELQKRAPEDEIDEGETLRKRRRTVTAGLVGARQIALSTRFCSGTSPPRRCGGRVTQ